jgi:phytoene synthase
MNNLEIALHLQRLDYDRYVLSMRSPVAQRGALHALLALNLEAARVRETTSDEMTGLIRLTWWREALEELREGKPAREHPLVQRLAEEALATRLPELLVDELLTTRERDLQCTPITDMPALMHYANGTGGCLSALWLEIAAPGANAEAVRLARAAGSAWALVGMLRAIPHHAGHGLYLLPQGLLPKAQEELLKQGDGNALAPAVVAVMGEASGLAKAAWGNRHLLPLPARALALQAWLALRYLKAMKPETPWQVRPLRLRPWWLLRLMLAR